MRFLLGALLVAMVVGSACGPEQGQLAASPWPSPSQLAMASPSPSETAAPSSPSQRPSVRYTPGPWSWPTPQPVAGTRMLAITSSDISGSPTTVTMITIDGSRAATRQVISMPDLIVMDARADLALVSLDLDTQLALLNLQNGEIRLLPVSSPEDVGGARFSPDGAQAVVDVRNADLSHRLEIVTLNTGAVRPLLTVPSTAYHAAGLWVLRWAPAGILVTPGVWDLLPSQVYRLDPLTGALTLLDQGRVEVTSPAGTMLAAPNYLDLGDAQYEGQGRWPNQLVEGPIGGKQTVVAQQKNRGFSALDIADDGSLLYAVDGDASTVTPASDMGLYLARGGRSVKLAAETWTGEWAASFAGPDQVLAIQARTTSAGFLEIDLIGLCSIGPGCTPEVVPVMRLQGDLPTGGLLPLD